MKAKLTSKELYQRGNIIWSDYWKHLDRVLSVDFDEAGYINYVMVQRCDKDFNPIEPPRTHCTEAWRNDAVVGTFLV